MDPASRSGDEAAPSLVVYFDGDCPLCRREVELIRWLDRRGGLGFVNIADPSFEPSSVGRTRDELMASLHARLSDGAWIDGVEVFRRMYAAVGLSPLVAVTRLPGLSTLLDAAYGLFARNRLRLTGRCDSGSCAARPIERRRSA